MTTGADPRGALAPQVEMMFTASAASRPQRVLEAAALRASHDQMVAFMTMGAPETAIDREIAIPCPAGPIRARLFAPRAGGAPMPLFVHIHGGGFVVMSPDTHARVSKQIALGAEAVVVSIDYRRAPEAAYPEPLDDCVAAYRWLRENAGSLNADASRIAVGGDSAGGNLSAATVLRLLAEGDAPPKAVVLMCAWLDLTMSSEAATTFGPDDGIIDSAIMDYFRHSYAPEEAMWRDPLVSPVQADVSAYPPTMVVVGGIDPLRDDGLRFAERLRAANRDVALQVHEGLPHAFMLWPILDPLHDSMAQTTTWLRDKLST